MNLYSQFKTDANLETSGIWLEYGTTDDNKPVRFKIARAGGSNKAFLKAIEKATRPYRKALQNNMMDNAVADRLFKDVFAETVVLGWENVKGPDDQPIPFNKANAIKLFNDLPDLFQDIREQANQASLYREELLEADLGNSGKFLSMD